MAFASNVAIVRSTLSYEGWIMVLIGFTCQVLVFSAPVSMMPMLYGEVIKEFGWTRTDATLIFTYQGLLAGPAALLAVGPMIERFGLKTMLVGSSVITGLVLVSFLWINSIATYYTAGAVLGLGLATVIICVNVFVSRWFSRNQGVAVGVTSAGISVGGVIFPLIGAYLIDTVGWRLGFALASLGIWFVALPLVLFRAKFDPGEEDILPETVGATRDPAMAAKLKAADLGVSFDDIRRQPMFWMLAVAVFLVSVVDNGMFQHTMLYLQRDVGLSREVAALGLSGTFAIGVLAKIGAGWVYDRYSIKGIQCWYVFVAIGVGLAFPVAGLATLLLFTLGRGVAHGGLVSEGSVLAKHCYGPRLMNKVLPVLTGIFTLGAAAGPIVLSQAADRFGSYTLGFVAYIVISLIAAVLLQGVRPLYRERLAALDSGPTNR